MCTRSYRIDYSRLVPQPRTVSVISRIYSPSTPSYIDVHLTYHFRMRYYETEWSISLGYKIHTRPLAPTSPGTKPADLDVSKLAAHFRSEGLETMHTKQGWRSITWGMWDPMGGTNHGPEFRRIELRSCDLYPEGIVDVHEALFGPYPYCSAWLRR